MASWHEPKHVRPMPDGWLPCGYQNGACGCYNDAGQYCEDCYDVPTVAAYAREWASDCTWGDAPDFYALNDYAVIRSAARHYDGGLTQLVRDALAG